MVIYQLYNRILGLPGAPIGPLDVSDITTHMCNLHWRPPAYDGGMRITHYVVERKDITHTHWVIVSSFCKETTCIVHGLTENQEYLFRVMAVNENGMGPALTGVNPIKAKMPYGNYYTIYPAILILYHRTRFSKCRFLARP